MTTLFDAIGSVVRVGVAVQFEIIYPNWMKHFADHLLLHSFPKEFDLLVVERWQHPGQKENGRVLGSTIYTHIQNDLQSFAGILALWAIKSKGADFYRHFFGAKKLFGWSSVIENVSGVLFVPFLVLDEKTNEVLLRWRALNEFFGADCVGLRAP